MHVFPATHIYATEMNRPRFAFMAGPRLRVLDPLEDYVDLGRINPDGLTSVLDQLTDQFDRRQVTRVNPVEILPAKFTKQ